MDYDLIVIGGGTAGMNALKTAVTLGAKTAVAEEGTERILGVHVIGAHAEDIIQIAAVAMRGGLKKRDVGAMHYVFPTIGGAIFDTMAA